MDNIIIRLLKSSDGLVTDFVVGRIVVVVTALSVAVCSFDFTQIPPVQVPL